MIEVLQKDLPPRGGGLRWGAHAVRRTVPPVPVTGFLGGVLLSQVANNALHLAQPLLVAELSGSLGGTALFTSFDTAVHMLGTLAGGWPADRWGSRRLLITSTFLRAASLALIPAAWAAGVLTLPVALAAYTLDAFVRGFVDTSVHALPLSWAEGERSELDRLNSRYEIAFDLGAVAGPLILAALMFAKKGFAAHAAIPVGFAAAALAFLFVPTERRAPSLAGTRGRLGGTWEGMKLVLADGRLLFGCLALAALNLYPLRKLLASFFAKALLAQPAAAGTVGAAFGLGGIAGSLLYARWGGKDSSGARWVAAGACGVVVLALGWLPASLAVMMAAAFAFALANAGARLALTRRLQEATPLAVAGGVTAVARFGSNVVSVVLKALVGVAFVLGAGPRGAFALVGAGLGLVALLQAAVAARLARPRAP